MDAGKVLSLNDPEKTRPVYSTVASATAPSFSAQLRKSQAI